MSEPAIVAGTEWCDKGEGRLRVLVLGAHGDRVIFKRLTPVPKNGEVKCDRAQFLMAYRPLDAP